MATSRPGRAEIVLGGKDETGAAFAAVSRNFAALQAQAVGVRTSFTAVAATVTTALAAIGAARKIELLDQLDKLSEKTGLSVEKLSELRYQGELANVPLDELAKGIQKLSKNMADAAGGSKDAAATFAAMGISVQNADGSLKSQDAILGEIADKFAGYEDGAAKAALAQRIFGKSGADLIPLLNQGSEGLAKQRKEAQELGLILGGDLAKNAAEFNDNLTRLKLVAESAAIAIGGPLIKSLNSLLTNYLELKKEGVFGDVVKDAAKGIFGFGKLSGDPNADLKNLARERERILKNIAFAEKHGYPTDGFQKDLAQNDRLTTVTNVRLRSQMKQIEDEAARLEGAFFFGKKPKDAPPIVDTGKGDQAEAILKRQLDARLKAIKDFAELQKVGIEFGNQLAEQAYSAGFLSVDQLFAKQQEAREAEFKNTTNELDAIIKAQSDFAAKALKPEDRIKAEGEIAEAQSKRAKAEVEFSQQSLLAKEAERAATQRDIDAYEALKATLLDLEGKTLEATQKRIDAQIRADAITVGKAGGDPAVLQKKREQLELAAELADVQKRYGEITAAAADKEASMLLAAQQNGAAELDTLRAVGAERQKTLAQLKELADAAAKVAEGTTNPAVLAAARQLALSFHRAAAEADPLLQKTRDFGKELGDAAASAAEEALLHWQGVRSLLAAVEQDMLRLILRSQVTKPFGDWLGNLIGGNGQASGGGGLLGRILPSLFGGGVSNVAFGATSFADALAAGVIPLASGTNEVPQDMLALVHKGEAVIPKEFNKAGMGGPTIHLVQNFPPGTTKATTDQAAHSAGIAIQRALARNG